MGLGRSLQALPPVLAVDLGERAEKAGFDPACSRGRTYEGHFPEGSPLPDFDSPGLLEVIDRTIAMGPS